MTLRPLPFLPLLLLSAVLVAQAPDDLDTEGILLTYHKLSGDPLDYAAAAHESPAYRQATNFDRPDIEKTEVARLQSAQQNAGAAHEFSITVNTVVGEYDHENGRFPVDLFQPGHYVPLDHWRLRYQLVFANAAPARYIVMPKEQARDFDAELRRLFRGAIAEIRFRVTGQGDPEGAVTGPRTIRAEITSARVVNREGKVLLTPSFSGSAPPPAPAPGAAPEEISGLRIGGKASDLEPVLTRLFGKVERAKASNSTPRYAATLTVNSMGCLNIPGRRRVNPGAVCVTAFLDGDDVVRALRIERVFAWFSPEVFRSTFTSRYGPVAGASDAGNVYGLGWGAAIDPTLAYDRSGPKTALAAYYTTNDDFMSRGTNSLAPVRLTLQLVDAAWASGSGK